MRVLVEDVREAPVEWREELEVSAEELEGSGLLGVGPVRVDGRLSAVEDGILIHGELSYEQTLSCDRCLEPVVEPVAESFDLLAVAAADASEVSVERELEAEELDVVPIEGEEIDTDPLVIEQIRLNVPMKPLCDPDCKGLCPRCGAPLNQGSCECPPAPGDPRWAGLAALRDRETSH